MSKLRLDWASYDAARFAVVRWHYSRSLPASRIMVIGVWENDVFKGVVTFSRGATPRIGLPYKLSQFQVCELTRIALDKHDAPVSRIVAIAIRMVRAKCPDLRLMVSYAAAEQGHYGGIYQAGGWLYEGAMASHGFMLKGRFQHARTISSRYGVAQIDWLRANVDPMAKKVTHLVRHKYLMPLDEEMRQQIAPLAKPYPKRVKQATDGDQPDGGGATPTHALQNPSADDETRPERDPGSHQAGHKQPRKTARPRRRVTDPKRGARAAAGARKGSA